jgi:hypothetical protein
VKWASAVLSLAIIVGFACFYLFHYRETVEITRERDFRLLATAGEAVRQSTGGSAEQAEARRGQPGCPRGVWVEIYPTPSKSPAPPASTAANAAATNATPPSTPGPSAPASSAPPKSQPPEGNASNSQVVPSRFCVEFKQMLGFVPRASQVFAQTLVVSQDDEVLAQQSRPGLPNLASLRELRQFGPNDKPTDKPVKLSEVGMTAKVHFGDGETFRLFCQASAALTPSQPGAPAERIHLCGLASESAMRSSSLSISPLLVILSGGLLALTLLIPPFLKLRLLGVTQRLGFGDAFALAACTALALMLLTLLSLGTSSYFKLIDFADAEISALSKSIDRNFNDELTKAREQLDAFGQQLPTPSGKSELPGVFKFAADGLKYPALETLAWADHTGQQRLKASPTLPVEDQQLLNIATREYFRRALAKRDAGLVVDAVRTWSTGTTRAIIARHTDKPPNGMETTPIGVTDVTGEGVLFVSSEMRSLTRPLLPPGFAFCVVNAAGDVLFHSEPLLSRSHNLVTESERNPELRRLIEAKQTGSAQTINYFGKAQRAYVRFLDGDSNLSLVVLADEDGLRSAVFQGTLAAVRHCLAYIGAWLGLVFVYVLVWSKTIPWFWPDPKLKATYIGLAIAFSVLGVFAYVLMQSLEQECVAFFLPLLLALASGASIWLGLHTDKRYRWSKLPWLQGQATRRMRESNYWVCYSFAAFAFWVVCAIVPTHAFGRLAMDRAACEFARARELSYATALETGATLRASGSETYEALDAYRSKLHLGSATELESLLQQELRLHWGEGTVHPWASLAALLFFPLAIPGLIFSVRWSERHLLLGGVDPPDREPFTPELVAKHPKLWCITPCPRRVPLEHDGCLVLELFDRSPSKLASALDAGQECVAAGTAVAIVCDRTPAGLVAELEALALPEARLVERVREISQTFRLVYLAIERPSPEEAEEFAKCLFVTPPSDLSWLVKELRASRDVYEACVANLAPGALQGVERKESERRLRDAAFGVYHELWSRSTQLEKLTLVQIAEEGFVNEKRRETVRGLLGRALLTRRPMLALSNDGFASFVRGAGTDAGARRWEARPEGFSWAELRAPLFTLFACTATVLFYTEPTLADSTILWATTLTGILPNLGRLAVAAGFGAQRLASVGETVSKSA